MCMWWRGSGCCVVRCWRSCGMGGWSRELEGARDELVVAEAELVSARAVLQWRLASQAEQFYEATGEHLTLGARLARERAALEERRIEVGTTRALHGAAAATDHELRVLEINLTGQRRSVVRLERAVGELGERVEASRGLLSRHEEVLGAKGARVTQLERRVARLAERVGWCVVRSPVDGVVVGRLRRVGEHCAGGEAVVSVVDRSSLGAVLYVRQGSGGGVVVGEGVWVVPEGGGGRVRCRCRVWMVVMRRRRVVLRVGFRVGSRCCACFWMLSRVGVVCGRGRW